MDWSERGVSVVSRADCHFIWEKGIGEELRNWEEGSDRKLYELHKEKRYDMRIHKIYLNNEIEENDMVGSCSTHGEKVLYKMKDNVERQYVVLYRMT